MLKIKEITERPPPETIIKWLTVDGLMIILRHEDVENWQLPPSPLFSRGKVNET